MARRPCAPLADGARARQVCAEGLARAGHAVSVIARGAHLAAIEAEGLTLRVEGGETIRAKVRAAARPEALGPQEAVIVGVKATGLGALAAGLPALVGPETLVVYPQNGMPWWYPLGLPAGAPAFPDLPVFGLAPALLRTAPARQVAGGVIWSSNEVEAPGVVVNRTPGRNRLEIGAVGPEAPPRIGALRAALAGAGIDSPAPADIRTAMWRKLVQNMSGSALALATGNMASISRQDDALGEVYLRLAAEGLRIAAAHGHRLDAELDPRAMLASLPDHRPSILQDYERGRPMEIGEIVLAPVAFARAAGLATPTLDAVAGDHCADGAGPGALSGPLRAAASLSLRPALTRRGRRLDPPPMKNVLLYVATVLIWGASWIGVAFQIEEAAPVHAVLYRYALAAGLIFLWLAATGRLRPVPARAHLVCLAMGIVLFAGNYVMVYEAIGLGLASGVAAVIFSLLVVMNAANSALFYGERPGPGFAVSAGLGLAGIGLLFWEDLAAVAEGRAAPVALLLCVGAVYGASLGNMASRRLAGLGVDVMTANGWAMLYASLGLLLWSLAFARPFTWGTSPAFVVSLLLLTIFSTVVAFWTYFTLLQRIGAGRAAYSFVAFPAVALLISSVFEDYRWTAPHLLGVALVAAGNVALLRGARPLPGPRPASPR